MAVDFDRCGDIHASAGETEVKATHASEKRYGRQGRGQWIPPVD